MREGSSDSDERRGLPLGKPPSPSVRLEPRSEEKEEGMVTVEMAIGFGALVLVLCAMLAAVTISLSQARLCNNVRIAAREYSIGDGAWAHQEDQQGRPINYSLLGGPGDFTVVGVMPGITIGEWSVTQLTCEVSGTAELWPRIRFGDG